MRQFFRLILLAPIAAWCGFVCFFSITTDNMGAQVTAPVWLACFLLCFVIEGIGSVSDLLRKLIEATHENKERHDDANDHLATMSEGLRHFMLKR